MVKKKDTKEVSILLKIFYFILLKEDNCQSENLKNLIFCNKKLPIIIVRNMNMQVNVTFDTVLCLVH